MKSLMLNKKVKNLYVKSAKDYLDKNGKSIMVGYNLTTNKIMIVKDFLNTENYLSIKEYNLYKQKYSNKAELGKFYDMYEKEGSEMWEIIGEPNEKGTIIMTQKAHELFSKNNLFLIFADYRGYSVKK